MEADVLQVDPKLKRTMITIGIVPLCVCIVALTLYIILFSGSSPQTSAEFAEEYGGTVELYQKIFAAHDCTWLSEQRENAHITYQNFPPGSSAYQRAKGTIKAAEKRMKEIGCEE
ncbi:MAG: hypothetical protein Kow002_16910 [Anaerolineales bacterium]